MEEHGIGEHARPRAMVVPASCCIACMKGHAGRHTFISFSIFSSPLISSSSFYSDY